MVVAVQTEPTFAAGNTELLFEGSYTVSGGGRDYDIAPEGQRFLMIREGRESAESDDPFAGLSRIHVVLNWFTELQARVPTGR